MICGGRQQMKILFLAANTGGGHVKAAEAIIEYMEENVPGCETELIDALKYANAGIDRLITGTYLQTIRKAPWIYRKLYYLSEKNRSAAALARAIGGLLSSGLAGLFTDRPPEAVICTHSIPLQMVSKLKRAGIINIPVIAVVTDFASHSFWCLKETDAFIVAHEDVRFEMAALGIDKNRIHAFGIPVSQQFTRGNGANGSRTYGHHRYNVFLMGGSLGLCSMQETFSALLKIDRDIGITAVTGYNTKLKRRLEQIAAASGKDARVFGYTRNISELMDKADLIITKPGGVTIAEALVKKLPIFFMDAIPGHEERNARFLLESGAACWLPPGARMPEALEQILDSPKILQSMSESAAKLARPNACAEITRLVTDLIRKKNGFQISKVGIPGTVNIRSGQFAGINLSEPKAVRNAHQG
mgnify:CR=1 FL=1